MHRTVNIEGRILDCNQAYVKNLGYRSKDEVVGHSIFEHTAPESLEAMKKSLEEWCSTGSVRNNEISLKRKDGTVFPGLINACNLYDNDGLVGSNTAIVDITEIHRAKELLEKANQMKDHFMNIAAHELRIPIQPILGAAEMARSGKIKHEEAWDTVLKEAHRLVRLANNMLDVTKIESGFLDYNIRKTSINEVIAEVIDSAR
jgi:PAS domain S-box-containing protein